MLGPGCEWIASKAQSAWRSVKSSRAWNATVRYARWEGGSAGSAGTPVRPGATRTRPILDRQVRARLVALEEPMTSDRDQDSVWVRVVVVVAGLLEWGLIFYVATCCRREK